MIGRLLRLTAMFLLASCSARTGAVLPEFTHVPGKPAGHQRCAAVFPHGSWQFVHDIAFHMAKGDGSALGVLVLDDGEIRCALMTIEGLTLFEARATEDGRIEVSRAIAPFDNPDFAAGLMRDLRTIFRPPAGRAEYGRLADDAPLCRYANADGVTDIRPRQDGCWSIATSGDRLGTKSIRASSCRQVDSAAIPERLELVASGPAGYTLNLQLISAERRPAAK